MLSEAYRHVAHGAIRNRGTLCGNLCHADPASEMPAVMLACGATMVVQSQRGRRSVPAATFFHGLYATDVQPDELLVEVRVPVTPKQVGWGFQELAVRKGDFAMTLVAALLDVQGGTVAASAIAYAGVSDRALRVPELEAMLAGKTPSAELFSAVADQAATRIAVTDDVHADRDYRRDLVRTLTRRTLAEAASRAAGAA